MCVISFCAFLSLTACATQFAAVNPTVPSLNKNQRIAVSNINNTQVVNSPAAYGQAYPIGPGDILQVLIYAGGEKQEDFTVVISSRGIMVSPLIGEVEVGKLTAFELAERMTQTLARDFFVNPQVLVSVKEYGRKIYVLGEVKKPGAYSYREGLTALNACVLAGGFTEYALPGRVKVTRLVNDKPKVFTVNLMKVQSGKEEDILLEAGDRIAVPERRF